MLSSITPLGERGRASRWSVTVTAYVLGSASGGAALGALLGALGELLPLQRGRVAVAAVGAVAVLALLAALAERGRLPAWPSWQRQVDEDWLHRYRGWLYGVGFGAQLGTGVVTIITSPLLHVALLLAVLTGSPAAGLVVGLVFGVVRALPVVAARRVTTPARLRDAHRRLAGLALTGSLAASGALLAVSVAAVARVAVTGGAAWS